MWGPVFHTQGRPSSGSKYRQLIIWNIMPVYEYLFLKNLSSNLVYFGTQKNVSFLTDVLLTALHKPVKLDGPASVITFWSFGSGTVFRSCLMRILHKTLQIINSALPTQPDHFIMVLNISRVVQSNIYPRIRSCWWSFPGSPSRHNISQTSALPTHLIMLEIISWQSMQT